MGPLLADDAVVGVRYGAKRPRAVQLAIGAMTVQLTLLFGYAVFLVIESFSSPRSPAGGFLLFVVAPPAGLLATALYGLLTRRAWGYVISVGVLSLFAILAILPLADEPTTYFTGLWPPTTVGSLILVAWLLLIAINAIPALALLSKSARAWFGFRPRGHP